MTQHSSLAEQLAMTDKQLLMVELALSGLTTGKIAKQMGVQRRDVIDALDDALAEAHKILIEKVERLHMMQLMVLEQLKATAMPYALGWVDKETGLPTDHQTRAPDRAWLHEVTNIVKITMEWEDRLYNRRAKFMEQLPDNLRQTMTGNDEMYHFAQEKMEIDYLGEYADMQTPDLIPPRTTQADVDRAAVIYPEINALKKEVDKLMEATSRAEGAGAERDDDDE